MKTTKHFFDNYNKLNKGYAANANVSDTDRSFGAKRFSNILPPIEVLQEYEDIHPGSMAKILKLAEKEQEHKHRTDLMALRSQELRLKFAKNVLLLCSIVLSFAAILLALLANNIYIFIGTITALLIAAGGAFLSRKKLSKPVVHHKFSNSQRPGRFNRKNSYKYK
jgi:uncharacterized membrane protein